MNLESDKRLNIQLGLDFSSMPTGVDQRRIEACDGLCRLPSVTNAWLRDRGTCSSDQAPDGRRRGILADQCLLEVPGLSAIGRARRGYREPHVTVATPPM